MVSVITVNFNAGALLTEVVGSALADTNVLEVLVSDNGSTDDSLTTLRRVHGDSKRLVIIENRANLGFSCGNNVALERARGDWLLFLNPDCLLQAGTLGGMLDFMRATPRAGMSGCVIRNPDGSEQAAGRRRIPDPYSSLVRFTHIDALPGVGGVSGVGRSVDLGNQALPSQPIRVEAISGAFMLVRRQALDEVGPLDEAYFLHCEDLDWFVRFEQAGWEVWFVPGFSVVHHQGSCSRATPVAVEWHKHNGMVRFFRKFQFTHHSRLFGWFVIAGIWLRFGLVALTTTLGRLFRRSD